VKQLVTVDHKNSTGSEARKVQQKKKDCLASGRREMVAGVSATALA